MRVLKFVVVEADLALSESFAWLQTLVDRVLNSKLGLAEKILKYNDALNVSVRLLKVRVVLLDIEQNRILIHIRPEITAAVAFVR